MGVVKGYWKRIWKLLQYNSVYVGVIVCRASKADCSFWASKFRGCGDDGAIRPMQTQRTDSKTPLQNQPFCANMKVHWMMTKTTWERAWILRILLTASQKIRQLYQQMLAMGFRGSASSEDGKQLAEEVLSCYGRVRRLQCTSASAYEATKRYLDACGSLPPKRIRPWQTAFTSKYSTLHRTC